MADLAAQAQPQQMWEDHYWTSRDGLRLHYRDYPGSGDRPPILCLHGLTRNARDFESVAERLAGEWRVIVPDFRGRAMSDWDPVPSRYAPPTYAADILQLLDLLEIPRAVFIGTSLGGLVTMVIASVAPQRVAGTLLNDVGPELDPAGLDRISGYVGRQQHFDSWDDAAREIGERNREVCLRYGHQDWLRFARRICSEAEDGISFDYDMRIADNFRLAQVAPPADAWPMFRALSSAPLAIVRGELSDLLAPDVAERMAETHGNAELVTVPDIGHAPDLSEPEAVAAIDRLLERVRHGHASAQASAG